MIGRAPALPMLLLAWGLLLAAGRCEAAGCDGPTLPSFRKIKGRPIPVTVVANGAAIRRGPTKSGASSGTAAYLQVFYLLDTVGEGAQKMYLVGTAAESWDAPESCNGWLADEDVLVGDEALKDQNKIYLKGLIINEWRQVPQGVEISGASLWNGPLVKAPNKKIGEIGLFNFYYVFKESSRNGGVSYLLGETANIENTSQPARFLVGWVDGKRLLKWTTRQAIEINKDTAAARIPAGSTVGARIFATQEELVADLRGVAALNGKPLEPIAEEDPAVKQWSHQTPRFPLVERAASPIGAAGALYRVGFMGDQITVDGETRPAEEVNRAVAKTADLLKDLDHLDLLFVIDSTGSMRQYFAAASNAVIEIARKIKKEFPVGGEGPEIRFSVVFYRDFVDEDGLPNPADTYLTKRLPFTGSPDIVARFLKDEEKMICEGCGGDEPEAMFYGIDYALANASREAESGNHRGFRALILIGDNGNHAVDPRGLDPAKVARALDAQNYEFFSLQVVAESEIDKSGGTRAFRDQCLAIGRFLESKAKVERFASRDPDSIVRNIVDTARGMAKDLTDANDYLERLRRGEIGLVEGGTKYGVRLTRRLTQMMRDEGIDPSVFLKKSVQLFERGWIAERDVASGQPQVKIVLLVDRATLEQLLGVLAGLTSRGMEPSKLEALWTKVLQEVALGEIDTNKPVADLIESHLGIPVRKKLLNKTLHEISNLPPRELNLLHSELVEDLNRVRALLNGEKIALEREVQPDGSFDVRVRKLGSRQVWWTQKGTREYGWIPAEELP